MAIRWRKQDEQKLSTYVRKFNAAITRLINKTPELSDSGVFPEKLVVSEVRQRIINRKDFNRELKKIDRFFKPKSRDIIKDETGYYTTRWAKNELKYLERRINAQRKAFIEKYKVPKKEQAFLGLEQIDLSKARKSITQRALKQETPEESANVLQEWYNLIYKVERESSGEYLEGTFAKLRNAYFKAIDEHMPSDKAKELKDYLKQNDIWGNDIVYAISINDILDFEYFYSTEEEENRAEVMLDRWKKVMPSIKESTNYKNRKNKKT